MHIFVFRLSLFGDFEQFKPSTEKSIKWTQELESKGYYLLPSILPSETSIINGQINTGVPVTGEKRMQFISTDGNMVVRVLSERLDIEFSYDTDDVFEKTFEDNCKTASNIMEIMLSLMNNIKGNRLAYYADIMIPKSSDDDFNKFYNNYNLGLEYEEAEDNCVEWGHRFNRRSYLNIGRKEPELCNVIFSIESGVLQFPQSETNNVKTEEGIRICADINTLAENVDQRFSIDEYKAFLMSAQIVYTDIIEQLKERIYN